MADLSEVLNYTFEDAPESQPLPQGTYTFRVHKVRTDEIPNDDRTPYAELVLIPVEVNDAPGVDGTNLRGYYPVRGKLWLNDRSREVTGDIIRRSFRRDGSALDISGKSVAMVIDELIGTTVKATVKTRMSDQGKTFVEIDKWLRPAA